MSVPKFIGRTTAALWSATILSAFGCAERNGPAPASTQPAEKTYQVVGIVRSIDQKAGEITIRHEEIAGYMKPMTMPFSVANRAELVDVQVGDKVKATLRVGRSSSTLSDLVVTEFAPTPEVSVSIADGKLRVVEKPSVTAIGEKVPDFSFQTQNNEKLRLSDLRGKFVVLTFIYTRCPLPDFCPLVDRKFAELADRIGSKTELGSRTRLLSISFDPEHDTPDVLARHARLLGAIPPFWRFAVADHDELAKAAPLGLVYGPTEKEIIHNRLVVVVDPQGRLVERIVEKDWKPADLAAKLAKSARDF